MTANPAEQNEKPAAPVPATIILLVVMFVSAMWGSGFLVGVLVPIMVGLAAAILGIICLVRGATAVGVVAIVLGLFGPYLIWYVLISLFFSNAAKEIEGAARELQNAVQNLP